MIIISGSSWHQGRDVFNRDDLTNLLDTLKNLELIEENIESFTIYTWDKE
jgi:hypothetical protein